jgi:Membrane bound beta barrel domain (DUF5777)
MCPDKIKKIAIRLGVVFSLLTLVSTSGFGQPIEPTKQPEPATNLKVVFDPTDPNVMIVESNGEKYRVNSLTKSVEKIAAPIVEKAPEALPAKKSEEEIKAAQKAEKKEKSDEEWDYESGEEPYDYKVVNVPTPKKVPKGTWNMSFSHRFSQTIRPFSESGRNLLGFDSFSASSFGISYGITDKLYVNAHRSPICQKGLCRTIELGIGYHVTDQNKKSPVAFSVYGSIEGNENFSEEYTYNLQAMVSRRVGKRVFLFFAPAVHLNSNGQRRFNPRASDYFPPATAAVANFSLPTHGATFGFGTSVMITPTLAAMFDFAPRTGFKLGQVQAKFDSNFNVIGFTNVSHPTIGFGIQKNIGKHGFSLTFSNSQTSTTSKYNSSNLVLAPKDLTIGFNLFRRW